jgi:tetratricopeptide (TPR) repeat protein
MSSEEAAEVDRAWLAQGLVVAGDLDRALELRPTGKKLALFAAQQKTTRPYYDAFAERYHDDADRQFEAATQLWSLGWSERALPFYERALELRPDDFRVALDLALVRADQSQGRQAIDDLVHLRARRPGVALVHQNLGAILLDREDPGAAMVHFQDAIAADPHALGAWLGLGQAAIATGELDRAERALARVLVEAPWHAEAHRLLGLVAATRGDRTAAVAHYRLAADLAPYDRDVLRDLGAVLQATGALDEAIATYQRALVLHPRDYRTLDALGTAYTAAGRFEDAVDCHLRVLDIDPEGAEAAHHLGQALRGQNRPHEAAGAFCLALRLDPRLAAARRELDEIGKRCDEN